MTSGQIWHNPWGLLNGLVRFAIKVQILGTGLGAYQAEMTN